MMRREKEGKVSIYQIVKVIPPGKALLCCVLLQIHVYTATFLALKESKKIPFLS